MSRPAERPLACVIVLNYNGRAHLENCLPSIKATEYSPLRFIAADNTPTHDSTLLVTTLYPQVEWRASHLNRRWSSDNNVGNQYALGLGAQYVVLANNDVRVDPRWCRVAVQTAKQEPRIRTERCLPFVNVDRHGRIALRVRSFNGVFSFCILLYAVAWNIMQLTHTLRWST
jgi:glycosyltransferase involved in cell wall biosynthesis